MGTMVKQCIYNIIGYFCLIIGAVDFVSVFFQISPNLWIRRDTFDIFGTIILPRFLPNTFYLIIALIFIILSRHISKQISLEDRRGNFLGKIRFIQGIVLGLLLTVHFGRCLIGSVINQTISFLNINIDENYYLPSVVEIEKDYIKRNLPVLIMDVIGIIIGIWIVIRTDRKYRLVKAEAETTQK
jgi:hypothetical protein